MKESKITLDKQTYKWIRYSLYATVFLLLIIFFMLTSAGVFVNGQQSEGLVKDVFTTSGALGDAINGLLTPIVGFLAVITTFLAFIVQYKANQDIRNDISRDRFETKFFELIRLHKENLNEIEIDGRYRGRKAIVQMLYEFRFMYHVVINSKDEWLQKNNRDSDETVQINNNSDFLIEIAYTLFFNGIGDQAEGSKHFLKYFDEDYPDLVNLCIKNALLYQQEFDDIERGLVEEHDIYINSTAGGDFLGISYFPFDGHASKLGHYFRHIFQLVKFVVSNQELLENSTYEYIKTIRAQLSNHEQALFYFNSFFAPGKVWWSDLNSKKRQISYFIDWSVIKNVPENWTSFAKNPFDKFKEEIDSIYADLNAEEKASKLEQAIDIRKSN